MRSLIPRRGERVRQYFGLFEGGGNLFLQQISSSRSAHCPFDICDSVEGSASLVLDLETAAVFAASTSYDPIRGGPSEPGEYPDCIKRADGGRGLLRFLGALATALETRQLSAERESFFRGGAMEVAGVHVLPSVRSSGGGSGGGGVTSARGRGTPPGRPATRCLSRFAASQPARLTAGALRLSMSFTYTWAFQLFNARTAARGPRRRRRTSSPTGCV